jgi:hypothetical protein
MICAPHRLVRLEEQRPEALDELLIDKCIDEIQSFLESPGPGSSSSRKGNHFSSVATFKMIKGIVGTSEGQEGSDLNKCLLPNLNEIILILNQHYEADFRDVTVTFTADCHLRREDFSASLETIVVSVEKIRKRIHQTQPALSREKLLELIVSNRNPAESGRSSSQYSFVFHSLS